MKKNTPLQDEQPDVLHPQHTLSFTRKSLGLLIVSACLALATSACSTGSAMDSSHFPDSNRPAANLAAGGGTTEGSGSGATDGSGSGATDGSGSGATDGSGSGSGTTNNNNNGNPVPKSATPFPSDKNVLDYLGSNVEADNVSCHDQCPTYVVVDNTTKTTTELETAYNNWAKAVEESPSVQGSTYLIVTSPVTIDAGGYINLEKPDGISQELTGVVFTGGIKGQGANLAVNITQRVRVLGGTVEPNITVLDDSDFKMTGVADADVYNDGSFYSLPPIHDQQKISANNPLSYFADDQPNTYAVEKDGVTYQFHDVGVEIGGDFENTPQARFSMRAGNNPVAVSGNAIIDGYLQVQTIVPKANTEQIALLVYHPEKGGESTQEDDNDQPQTQLYGNFRNVVAEFGDGQNMAYLGVLLPAPHIETLTINNQAVDVISYPLVDYRNSPYAYINDDNFVAPIFPSVCTGCADQEKSESEMTVAQMQEKMHALESGSSTSENTQETTQSVRDHSEGVRPRDADSGADEGDANDDQDGDYDPNDDAGSSDDEGSGFPIFVQLGALTGNGTLTYMAPAYNYATPVVLADGGQSTASGTLQVIHGGVVGVYGTTLNMDVDVEGQGDEDVSQFLLSGSVKSLNNKDGLVVVFNGTSNDVKTAFQEVIQYWQPSQLNVPVQLISKGYTDSDIDQIVAYPVGGVVEGDFTQGASGQFYLVDGILAVKGKAHLGGTLYVTYNVTGDHYYTLAVLSPNQIEGKFSTLQVIENGAESPSNVTDPDAQKIMVLKNQKGQSFYALVLKMPGEGDLSTTQEYHGHHQEVAPSLALSRSVQRVKSQQQAQDSLAPLAKAVAQAETQTLQGTTQRGKKLRFRTRERTALSQFVDLMSLQAAPKSKAEAALQNFKEVINGSAFGRVNDMNANMQAFVASQGQNALLRPMHKALQVRLDAGFFFGNSKHNANLQEVSVVAQLGALRARAALNRMGNSYTLASDDLFSGNKDQNASAGLKAESRMYGVNAGLAYTLENIGVTVGAQFGYERVNNSVAKDQIQQWLPKAGQDLSYQQNVVQLDMLASKSFALPLPMVGQLSLNPFVGYRYGYESQASLAQQFKLSVGEGAGARAVQVDLKVPELSRHLNSVMVGLQAQLDNAFSVTGLSLGAALTTQFQINSTQKVSTDLTLSEPAVSSTGSSLGSFAQKAQATLQYKNDARLNLQAHVQAGYQFEQVSVGASLDALYHKEGEPVLFQVGLNAAVNF